MVKEEGVVADAGGGGRGYLDMLCLGEDAAAMDDYFHYPSPSSSSYQYQHSSAAISAAPSSAVASPGCASYLQPPPPLPTPPYHNILSFGGDAFGFPYYGGAGQAIPVAVPQKSSPTAECTSSISSMSSSPTATAASAISISKPQEQAPKKKGSRSSDQRKAAAPAAAANKRPRVRREKLGERIQALQQLVSPFGKSDTASVLHEALGYIRFLHDQVQVLSSPYMQRLPPSARGPASKVEQRAGSSDLRSRGLCLVPVACTEHVTGGVAGVWSSSGLASSTAQEGQQEDEMLRGDHHPGQLA